MKPERLAYRVDDVAELAGISRATIYRLIAAGKLKTIKIGGCRVVPAASLRAMISNKNVPTKIPTFR